MPLITVVIPAYNEEANVGRVYERLSSVFAALPVEWELIFSVDPSTDRTEEKALKLGALLTQPGRTYDVSSPDLPTVK